MKYKTDEKGSDLEEDCPSELSQEKKFDEMVPILPEQEVLTDRNGEVEDSELNDRRKKMNGEMKMDGRVPKEPVENATSDGKENAQENTEDKDDISEAKENTEDKDDISEALSKCHLSDKSEATECKDEDDIVGKISNLRVSEEAEPQDEGQFIEIKSSEIKTKEEMDIQKQKDAADKTVKFRGPTGGVATNFHPNSHCNQVAQKPYPMNVGCPVSYASHNYNQQGMMMNMQQEKCYQQMPNSFHPKRGRDDFEDQPMKYTRPGENKINNLSGPSKPQMLSMTYSNVSMQGFCGGQVAVTSPEEDTVPLFEGTTTSGEFELSFLEDKTFLECGQNIDPIGQNIDAVKQNTGSCQQYVSSQAMNFASMPQNTYVDQSSVNLRALMESGHRGQEMRTSFSECDGGSEGYGSEAIASPYSDQQDSPGTNEQSLYSPPPSNISVDSGTCSSMVPSPVSQIDIRSPRSNLSGYDTGSDTYNPTSPFTSIKQGGQTPQNLQHTQNISSQQYPPTCMPTMVRMDPPVSSPSHYQDCSQTSNDEEKFSDYFDENQHWKDVMETIVHDMIESEQSKQKRAQNIAKQAQLVQKAPVLPQQKPLSASPNQNRPVANVLPNQMNSAVPVSSTPLYFVSQPQGQQTIAPAGKPIHSQSKATPKVTTSQILVIPANPQPQPPAIVIVAPPMQPVKKVQQYRPIQPKIQPNPAPGKEAADANTKQLPRVTPSKQTPVSIARPPQNVSSTPPVAPVQPAPRPKPANQGSKNINQLNVARRLVATMKAEDLKFTDKDGDTFLHVAVCKADKHMVQALLERLLRENLQSMIDTQNNERQTPVYLAVSANQPDMVRMFNKFGADVNLLAEGVSSNGQKEVKAAIHCASCNGREYLQTLKVLLEAPDLNLNIVNSDGYTALHCAILEHNQPRHVNEDIRETMLDLKTDSKPIIEALIKAGADPNAQDKKSGKTAFMYALETRDYGLVETLLGLVDMTKIRSYFRTQAFDGSTCVKIMESRKSEFPHGLYERLSGVISNSKSVMYNRREIGVS